VALSFALGVIAVATACGIGLMLLARRSAPEGSRFRNQDHSAAVFGVIGTVFAILLGFIILFAFESHSTADTAASTEASSVVDAYEDAGLFGATGTVLKGELVCYARAVIHDGWPQMRDAHPSARVAVWSARISATTNALPVAGAKQATGFQNLLDSRNERDTARRVRLQEAGHTIPAIIWLAVGLACFAPLLYVLMFADPRESRLAQAMMAGVITALTVAAFLAVLALDDPFSGGEGGIPPTAMRYTVGVTEAAHAASQLPPVPCSAVGVPLT
jgi:hypothetical protein